MTGPLFRPQISRLGQRAVCVRIRNSAIEWCLARMAVWASTGLFLTVRRRFHFTEPNSSPYEVPSTTRYLYSVWHDSLLMPLFLGRQPATTALVGRHGDAGFLAHALTALGIPSVRGSSSRGGAQAVRTLLQATEGRHIVVTPDGPRGPRRVMKSGVAYLASRTGKPVIPTAFACRRNWSIGTGWTDLVVPRPGTTVYAVAGAAIHVPAEANRSELDDYTRLIQSQMDRLNTHALGLAAADRDSALEPALESTTRT